MRDIPIIYSGAMVRAMLDDRKVMTRRLAWQPPHLVGDDFASEQMEEFDVKGWNVERVPPGGRIHVSKLSSWQKIVPGDRLWVRESLRFDSQIRCWRYRADDWSVLGTVGPRELEHPTPDRWATGSCPSIHMPRFASRLTLTVSDTKVERLKDMSAEDAFAEGVCSDGDVYWIEGMRAETYTTKGPAEAFKYLWQHLHGRNAWDENPEVVALTFTVHKQNIDALPKQEAA